MRRGRQADGTGTRLRAWLPWILVALAAGVPYLNALRCGFVYDDEAQILENPHVAADAPWWRALARPLWPEPNEAGLYRPVTALTFRLQRTPQSARPPAAAAEQRVSPDDRHALRDDPRAFHAVNVALHAGVCLLAFAILRRLWGERRGLALAAALTFAVHPVHTEAVTGIVGRAELLAAAWGLAGYALWLRATRRSPVPRGGAGIATWLGLTLCFAVAAGSKESAVGWILLLGAHRLGAFGDARSYAAVAGAGGGILRRGLLADGSVALGFALYVAARVAVLGTVFGLGTVTAIDNPIYAADGLTRILTAGHVLARDVGLILWPARLSADYSFDVIRPVSQLFSLSALFLIALLAGVVAAIRHRSAVTAATWGLLLFVALILPVSNLLFPIGTIMGERLLYLPSLGLLVAALYPAHHLMTRIGTRRGSVILLVLLLVALSARTWARNEDWRSNRTLFGAAVRVSPRSVKARANLGTTLVREGEVKAGEHEYRAALAIAPEYLAALNGLAQALIEQGRFAEAEPVLLRATAHHPRSVEAHVRLGNLYLELERARDAEEAFGAAIGVNAESLEGWIGRASALFMQGSSSASAEAWLRAYELSGRRQSLGRHVWVALERARRTAEATELVRELLTREPAAADLHHKLALALLSREGASAEGLKAARRAADLEASREHLTTLLRHLVRAGRCAEAREVLHGPRVIAMDAAARAALADTVETSCGNRTP